MTKRIRQGYGTGTLLHLEMHVHMVCRCGVHSFPTLFNILPFSTGLAINKCEFVPCFIYTV